MALRALQPRAEKQLRRVLHLRLLRTHLLEPGRRRALVNPAGSRHNFPHKPIVRLVIVQALLDPVVKGYRCAKLRPVGALVAQQRRPFVGKILGVFLTAEQPLDESLAFVRRRVFEKGFRLGNSWEAPGDIKCHTTKISRVPCHLRWRHADLFPFRKNKTIHEVYLGRQVVHRGAQWDRRTVHRRLVLIANHHRNLTRIPPSGNQTGVVRLGVLTVVRLVHGGVGNVLDRPVGHPGQDDELLASAWLHDALGRMHLDGFKARIVWLAVRHSLAYPLDDRLVIK